MQANIARKAAAASAAGGKAAELSQADELARIRAMMDNSSTNSGMPSYMPPPGFPPPGGGAPGAAPAGGFQAGERYLPPSYICKRCNQPGHFIKNCPTNGDPAFDRRARAPPSRLARSAFDRLARAAHIAGYPHSWTD